MDIRSHLVQYPRVPSYKMIWREYTPEHYHALKHLQSWNRENFRAQMDRLLEEIPLDEDEALEMERWQRVEMDTDDESETDNEPESDNEYESDNESTSDAQSKSDDRPISINQSGSDNE